MVDYDMKQGKDGVYSVDNVVSQPSRKSKSGLLSKLGKAMRSGIAGAVALGSAYAVSMPQKASADLITSHADVLGPYDANYRDVLYESPEVVYYYADGITPITGGLENNIVLLFVKDHDPEAADYVVGGLTIQSGQNQTDSGWFWSSDDVGYLGLKPGEVAMNNLNGESYWIGGIDLNNDGNIGEYTVSGGNWNIELDDNEGMVYGEQAYPGAYYFTMEGVPQHPTTGTGPESISRINIYTTIVPEPGTVSLIGLGGAAAALAASRRRRK